MKAQETERVSSQREARRSAALQDIHEELHKERVMNSQFQRRIAECATALDEVKAAHKAILDEAKQSNEQV